MAQTGGPNARYGVPKKARKVKRVIGPPAPKPAGPAGPVSKPRKVVRNKGVVGPPAPRKQGPAVHPAGPAGDIGRQETNPRKIARKQREILGRHLIITDSRKYARDNKLSPLNRKLQSVGDVLAKPAQAVVKDYIDINANAVPSLYHLGKTTVTGHPGQAAKMLAEPYVQAAKHPIESFKEHPLGTALLLSGPKSLVGRTAGRTLRLAPKGSTLERAGSISRTAKTIEGTTLRQERSYSPDVITKAGQVTVERTQARKVRRLENKAATALRQGKVDRADELSTQAKAAKPTRMDVKAVQKRVDARVDANEIIRRQNRAKVTRQVDAVLPKKGKEAVPLVAQGITKPDPTDLAAYRTEITENAPSRPGRARQNKELRKQVKRAEKAPDMGAVVKAAAEYRKVVKPLQDKLVESGLLGKGQAEMAPLIPYATRHMGAKFGVPSPKAGSRVIRARAKVAQQDLRTARKAAKKLSPVERATIAKGKESIADYGRLERQESEFAQAVENHRNAAAVARERGRDSVANYHERMATNYDNRLGHVEKALERITQSASPHPDVLRRTAGVVGQLQRTRVHAERASRAVDVTKGGGVARILDEHGRPLTPEVIRGHMREHGFQEPAYITQAPSTRGARNYYVAQHEAPSVSTRQRTGEATRKGTFDAHPDVLREGAARMQGLVDAHEGYSKFIGEFGHRGEDKQVLTFKSHSDAADHARDLAETSGVSWRPVKLKPFAGRKEQLQSLIDHTHPDNQHAVSEVSKALEDAVESTDGPGPWALVPKVAADRMSQHVRVQGAGAGGKAFQVFTGAFRKAVLATSFKWLFGNVAEAGLRAGVSRSGPRSYVTGKAILKRLQESDPAAAQELQARALGGGHYAMADRMPVRKAEQFKDTRLEPLANAMAAFWRAPGPKQVSDVWRHWTELVFHRINQPVESRFQTAMLGSEVRRQLMSDKVVKLSSKAIDEAAQGLRDTNTQARFAESVDRMYGQYSKFSPAQRRAIALYTPFIAWTLNALRFTAEVLPRDHPALTSLIVSAHQASEEWRKEHGLAKFMQGAVPGFLQGSIPKGEGKIRVSRYTPFGAFGDLPGTFADAVLPQGSSALAALKGQDWKGKELRDKNGQPIDDIAKFSEAFKALAEGTIPIVGQAVRVQGNEGGLAESVRQEIDPLKPIAPPKKKVSRSGGSSGWGGSSVGPSKTGWGG